MREGEREASPGGEVAVVFEPLYPDVEPPRRQTEGSAGFDLRAYLRDRTVRIVRSGDDRPREVRPESAGPGTEVGEDGGTCGREDRDGGEAARDGRQAAPRLRLAPGDRALVPTGFRARLPQGVEAQIRVRSSLALERGLVVPNAPGTIDPDYPDEWFVLLRNADTVDRFVWHGERIAQAVLARHLDIPWREGRVGITTDRRGGLGSTGR